MKVGDIVKTDDLVVSNQSAFGLVLEVDINMWHEEVIPTGVRVLWPWGELEVVYSDEIRVVSEAR
jgi:hypothetical protein